MSVKIDQAFISAIMGGGLALDIVHENGLYSVWSGSAYASKQGVYVPTANRAFIEIRNFPADEVAYSLNSSNSAVGLFQVTLKYPTDSGSVDVKNKAEELLNLFSIGGSLSYNSQQVFIQAKSRDGGRVDGGYYQVVCRVNYQAFKTR